MPLEVDMCGKAAAGQLADGGEGPFDLASMQAWGEQQAVRAAVLRHLLIAEQWPVDTKGVRLRGVRMGPPCTTKIAATSSSSPAPTS